MRLPFGLSFEQLTIWVVVFGVLWVLRDWISIVFMTYIMSYVANRIVGFLIRDGHPERSERWTRKPVVAIVYLTALAVGYLFVQTVFPLAVQQGRWLLEELNLVDLGRFRDDLLAMTVGRLELSKYKTTEPYKADLAKFREENKKPLDFDSAKRTADAIRNAFTDDLRKAETTAELGRLRQSPDFDEQYKRWLKIKVEEPKLAANPQLRDQLTGATERELAQMFETTYKEIKDTPSFKRDVLARAISKLADEDFKKAEQRDRFENETAAANAVVKLGTLPAVERDERFRAFYRNEVPHRFPDFRLNFDEFKTLETVGSEAEYKAKFKTEDLDDNAIAAKFDYQQALHLGREHPMAKVLADSSNVLREHLPQLTGWLTNAINNVLTFCLHALLSLGLSFMIIWEMPHIRRGLASVKGTRVEPLFDEIAPTMARLGQTIGIAFSAQFLIASIDAGLAFVALWWVGLGSSAVFLSLVVLICCLIPYIGVFFAAPPVLLLAIKEGGFSMAFKAGMGLLVIHELEAWLLSPWILGEFLRLSPILIVAVLCIAEPLFGIWGLLLGVPVAVYLINDVLLKPATPPVPAAAPPAPPPPATPPL